MADMADNIGDAVGARISNALGISTVLLDRVIEIIRSRGPMGNYSYLPRSKWPRERRAAGLQTARVDLLFNGDILDSIEPSPQNQKFNFVPTGTGSRIQGEGGRFVEEKSYVQSIQITDEKAPWHQFGTSRIPSRPFFGITDQEAQEIYSHANQLFASSTSGPVRGETLTATLNIR